MALAVVLLAACSQGASAPTVHGWTMEWRTQVGQTPGPITLGGQWAFVPNMSDGTVSQIDAASGHVVATIKVADPGILRAQGCAPDSVHAYYSGSWGWRACDTPYATAWDGHYLWALDNGDRLLVRVDPAKRQTTERIGLPGTGWSMAFGRGQAFVSGFADNHALYDVDLQNGNVTSVETLDTGPASLAFDGSSVWVACVRAGTGHLDQFDPSTKQVVARPTIEWWSTDVAADNGGLYVRGTFGGDISHVDPTTGAITWTQPGPGYIGRQGIDQMGAAADGIWMSGPTTSRVDLGTGQIVDRIRVPSASVASGLGAVWLLELDGSVAKFVLK